MIEKGHNIEKHPYLKRIVEHEGEQINFLDSRFYKTENGDYYPSVTTILGFYPKNKFFEILSSINEYHDVNIHYLDEKFSYLPIWTDSTHVAVNEKSSIYSDDITKIILDELDS